MSSTCEQFIPSDIREITLFNLEYNVLSPCNYKVQGCKRNIPDFIDYTIGHRVGDRRRCVNYRRIVDIDG